MRPTTRERIEQVVGECLNSYREGSLEKKQWPRYYAAYKVSNTKRRRSSGEDGIDAASWGPLRQLLPTRGSLVFVLIWPTKHNILFLIIVFVTKNNNRLCKLLLQVAPLISQVLYSMDVSIHNYLNLSL